MMDVKHISLSHVHEHPLVLLIQDESGPASAAEEGSRRCSACEEEVDGGGATPTYGCASGCNKFYLHKTCAEELEELGPELVNHPLHPLHPLILLPNAPYHSDGFLCSFCHGSFSGLVYHCHSCEFDLNVHCAGLLQSLDDCKLLQHPAHGHALVFVSETHNKQLENDLEAPCAVCGKRFYGGGSVYRCMDCYGFQLHKECAQLPVPLEITLPLFHPPHPLTFTVKELASKRCRFCYRYCSEFVYDCQKCYFRIHFDCALLLLHLHSSSKCPIILERSPHQHPLIFIEKLNRTIEVHNCVGCCKELSEGQSIYRCLNCRFVCLHKECAELPLEIDHPLDRKHPLTLLQTPPLHPNTCSCYICRLGWKGFVYYCHACELGILPKDVEPPPVIKAPNHEHPWFLIKRPISFLCDFCGTDGDRTPYLCTTCDLIVHRDCINSLPHGIRITRHRHPIFHSYFVPASQLENFECRICHKEVNTGFGSYRCRSASNCNYIVHVKCATDKNVWDGTVVEAGNHEGEDEEGESGNLITDVIRTTCVRGEEIAIEIKHEYHNHNLLLNNFDGSVDVEDDNNDIIDDDESISCDGCIKPISNTTPFYACHEQSCRRFFLHKTCAELPRNERHPIHKHSLSLMNERPDTVARCHACNRFHHGFKYSCKKCWFEIDIQCSSLSDTLMHASHQHPLFLIYNAQGNCSGCSNEIPALVPWKVAPLGYICTQRDQGCNFILDFRCLTLPQIARYKYDVKHPVTLTYHDDSDPNQCYCDLCEEERDPKKWFYSCVDCNTTLHPKCALGDLPFAKAGREEYSSWHPHRPLTFVKKIWNCPPCKACNKLCYGNVLQCKESDCNFIVHFECRWTTKN